MKFNVIAMLTVCMMAVSCGQEQQASESQQEFTGAPGEVKLMNLNPGHFHAALVQLNDYEQVDPQVYVYAPEGPELDAYLAMIERFNTRDEDPTDWNLDIYTGDDFLEQMLEEKPGNVMVVAGDNSQKIEYITRAVNEGVNVLADKPMIITADNFDQLKTTLEEADEQGLVVNDIMTERHAISTIMQRELSMIPSLFGEIVNGTPEEPAITKESVHYFYKTVAGEPLVRPAWFFDPQQQGHAIVDVSTHLVDLILWEVFPGEAIDYQNPDDEVEFVSGSTWKTPLTLEQFEQITTLDSFPEYLEPYVEYSDAVGPSVDEGLLHTAANGEFNFSVRGVHAKVSVLWDYTNPEGGDTHYSIMRGTLADLVIRQNVEQNFMATLYVVPTDQADMESFESTLNSALESLSDRYPGLTAENSEFGWKVNIPEEFNETHEEHFTRVTENFLDSLVEGSLSEWERTNLLTKYYITTGAYERSTER